MNPRLLAVVDFGNLGVRKVDPPPGWTEPAPTFGSDPQPIFAWATTGRVGIDTEGRQWALVMRQEARGQIIRRFLSHWVLLDERLPFVSG